jgi:glutathione synthase/RimK-type ligase-like ATP-grasp enzyme
MCKIGIILNYKKAERKKDELMCVDDSRYPWLKIAKNKKYKKYTILRKNKICVPADVAIGMYLEKVYKTKVDYITPEEISLKRLHQNDIVFVVIYDLVEAFHLSKKADFEKYKSVLKNAKNVYPPYQYQKFINNKCTYYKYLANKGIPVAPTHCVTRKKWLKRETEKYVTTLISKFKNNKWESVIAKPVYGQESIDFAKFKTKNGDMETKKTQLKKYLNEVAPKYKGIILQEYIKNFDKSNPEFRMYYLNGKYSYCIITVNDDVVTPKQEGGKYKVSADKYKYLKQLSKRVLHSLPKLKFKGKSHNPVLTRIDIGSGLEKVKYSFFVNEVEFVPSLYIEDQKFPVVQELSKGLYKTAKMYAKGVPLKTIF